MSVFPKTELELEKAGYEFTNTGKCRACGCELAWYRTPRGKAMPLEEGTLEPHWAKCPKADEFRRGR